MEQNLQNYYDDKQTKLLHRKCFWSWKFIDLNTIKKVFATKNKVFEN